MKFGVLKGKPPLLGKKVGLQFVKIAILTWWGKMDSNHRRHCQQIYSLSPLATREFPHIYNWSWWTDSNPRPADYKSAALPTELHQRLNDLLNISQSFCFVNTFSEIFQSFFNFESAVMNKEKTTHTGVDFCNYYIIKNRIFKTVFLKE